MLTLKQIFLPLFLFILLCNTSTIAAQSLATKIDSLILTEFNDKNGPGGVFLVAQNGKAIYQQTPKMMVEFFKNEPTDLLPGEKFEYNNSGYVLLGYIIALVSEETYEDFIEKHIFQKAGMSQSYYASDRQLIHKRAYGYQKKEMDM
jgi:hypothetical protein